MMSRLVTSWVRSWTSYDLYLCPGRSMPPYDARERDATVVIPCTKITGQRCNHPRLSGYIVVFAGPYLEFPGE